MSRPEQSLCNDVSAFGVSQTSSQNDNSVCMLHFGGALSRLELLSIASFAANGHAVNFYTFDAPSNLPTLVHLRDPRQILAHTLHRTNISRWVSGGLRNLLLLEVGGMWATTDMVCLRALDFVHTEVFGWLSPGIASDALVKLPPDHPLAHHLVNASHDPTVAVRDPPGVNMATLHARKVVKQHSDTPRDAREECNNRRFTDAVVALGLSARAFDSSAFYPLPKANWLSLYDGTLEHPVARLGHSYTVKFWAGSAPAGSDTQRAFHGSYNSVFERLCRHYLEGAEDSLLLPSPQIPHVDAQIHREFA